MELCGRMFFGVRGMKVSLKFELLESVVYLVLRLLLLIYSCDVGARFLIGDELPGRLPDWYAFPAFVGGTSGWVEPVDACGYGEWRADAVRGHGGLRKRQHWVFSLQDAI